jgi:hypothetical protein
MTMGFLQVCGFLALILWGTALAVVVYERFFM